MVQMYSKSANVNDLGLHGQPGPRLCMDRPSSLFLRLICQVVCHALQRHTAPSLHLPLFLEETFLHILYMSKQGGGAIERGFPIIYCQAQHLHYLHLVIRTISM